MNTEKKSKFYLFWYNYKDVSALHYRFVRAIGKKEAKHKFIMSFDQPITFYNFKQTNDLPLLYVGEVLEKTIE